MRVRMKTVSPVPTSEHTPVMPAQADIYPVYRTGKDGHGMDPSLRWGDDSLLELFANASEKKC